LADSSCFTRARLGVRASPAILSPTDRDKAIQVCVQSGLRSSGSDGDEN
jgi:hypothetical protein